MYSGELWKGKVSRDMQLFNLEFLVCRAGRQSWAIAVASSEIPVFLVFFHTGENFFLTHERCSCSLEGGKGKLVAKL